MVYPWPTLRITFVHKCTKIQLYFQWHMSALIVICNVYTQVDESSFVNKLMYLIESMDTSIDG